MYIGNRNAGIIDVNYIDSILLKKMFRKASRVWPHAASLRLAN